MRGVNHELEETAWLLVSQTKPNHHSYPNMYRVNCARVVQLAFEHRKCEDFKVRVERVCEGRGTCVRPEFETLIRNYSNASFYFNLKGGN